MSSSPSCPVTRDFSDQVRLLLHYRQWTQEALALASDLHQPLISRILRGSVWPTLTTLHRIAQALDCQLKIELVPNDGWRPEVVRALERRIKQETEASPAE
jgi:transcriptional regulator with XRE-family HTH domain